MAAIKYVFAEGEILAIKAADKANPQIIGEELEKIAQKAGGHLTPPAVVEAAKDRKNPLHRHFEWDDRKAAENYRLDQARQIVRCIHVENAEAENGASRAFLSVREKDGVSYRSFGDVLASADLQAKVLAAAERDLLAFEARYRNLEDVCSLIRQARQQISARRVAGHDNRAVA